MYIPTKFQQFTTRLVLAGLRFLALLKRATVRVFLALKAPISGTGRLIGRFLLLPAYKAIMMVRLRTNRLLLSARGLLFLLFTNRYVLHAVLLVISVATIGTQLQTKNATALDAGQRSLLYTLVTEGQETFVEEEVRPELLVRDSHYLGSETLEAGLGIDFDYDVEHAEEPIADLTVPGAIAFQPGADEPGDPSNPPAPTRTEVETYAVQEGDTVSTIAAKFGVNVATILWANGLTTRSTIKPGQSLRILPTSGVTHTVKKNDTLGKIAQTYKVTVEEIQSYNRLGPDSVLALNEELIIPGGTPPAISNPVAARTNINVKPDVPITRIGNKAYDIYQEITGSKDTREKPADIVETEPTAKLLWPTDSHAINQYFGWKHTGVDIHGRYNNAIYASEDGVVETSGWNSGGYGLQIVINHGNGMKTRYAHASKIFVKSGQTVKRGEVLAMVGTTGRSTGPHLHYEVIVNGKVRNPLAYTR